MLWSEKIEEQKNGNSLKIPNNINKPFIWRTSVNNSKKDLEFLEEFHVRKELFEQKQDYSPFLNPPCSLLSNKRENKKYSVNCKNLSGDTILIIPKVRKGKKFTNIYHFIKNASKKQQSELWKDVAKNVKLMLKKNENVWVSTHGLGVDYLHVRISNNPKYYESSKLKKLPKNK